MDRVTLVKGLPKVVNSMVSYCGFEAAAGTMGWAGIVDTSNKEISDVLDVSLENKEGVCRGVDESILRGGEGGV